ncbi:Hypothetical protein ABZS17H1_03904 [Kosakonia cowanii]
MPASPIQTIKAVFANRIFIFFSLIKMTQSYALLYNGGEKICFRLSR